jgi:hypothetical protein
MRKCSYDALGRTVETLQQKLKNQKDVLVKAIQEGSLENIQSEVDEVSNICKSIYTQFTDLKNDYYSQKLNLAWYKDYLSNLKNLLTGVDEKITCPDLHAEEIATELKRFF